MSTVTITLIAIAVLSLIAIVWAFSTYKTFLIEQVELFLHQAKQYDVPFNEIELQRERKLSTARYDEIDQAKFDHQALRTTID